MAEVGPASAVPWVDGTALGLVWTVPFVGVLASIALLPLVAPSLWHAHQGKVVLAWAALFVVPFALVFGAAAAGHRLVHAALLEYLPFVVLLLALYTVSGGIALVGGLRGSPAVNTGLLALGAIMANLMGTTGAAMLLVRPLIRANMHRRHRTHVIVFFIFIVANAGGSLTPLGDPPLFLGFLEGVSFFWPLTAMAAPTLTLCGALLVLFHAIDRVLAGPADESPFPALETGVTDSGLRLVGNVNVAFLAAIIVVVAASGVWRSPATVAVLGVDLRASDLLRDGALIAIVLASLAMTPSAAHVANEFGWGPMREVAKLFAAIFVTISPVLAILEAGRGGALAPLTGWVRNASGGPDAAAYFWLTGALSAFLDNAPTYLLFFNLAGGDADALMRERTTLQAISAGAVYMGALTYIGNAPNFMVRAIAIERGIPMPSFFGYMAWSCGILLPLFILLTFVFFR